MYSPFLPRGVRSAQGPGPRFGPSSTTQEHKAWEGFATGAPGKPCCSAIGVQGAASHSAYFPVHIFKTAPLLRCEASAARAAPHRQAPRTNTATAKAAFRTPNRNLNDIRPPPFDR